MESEHTQRKTYIHRVYVHILTSLFFPFQISTSVATAKEPGCDMQQRGLANGQMPTHSFAVS